MFGIGARELIILLFITLPVVVPVLLLIGFFILVRSPKRGRAMAESERQVFESISHNLERMEERMANLESIVMERERR